MSQPVTTVEESGRPAALELVRSKLVVLRGIHAGTELIIDDKTRVRVGARPGNDLVLTDSTISRDHLEIEIRPDGYLLRDLGSRNGTYVDGLRIKEIYLRAGTVVDLGKVALRFEPTAETVRVPLSSADRFGRVLGRSIPMRMLYAVLERVSKRDTTVLIEGETGTGKELIAEAIHAASPRASGPLLVFDASAVSPTLVESELFGHVKGAFTGADRDRLGILEEARGGTVLLDEIGELELELQPKLLRALESATIRRVGENRPRNLDVRILAATNRNLEEEVEAGRFRRDLYYRLAVVRVKAPPLRERREDIPELVAHFLRELGADDRAAAPELMAMFKNHDWPGNVRELRNAIERVVALSDDSELFAGALSFDASSSEAPGGGPASSVLVDPAVPLKEAKARLVADFERRYLEAVLAAHGGNVTAAARAAGIDRIHLGRLIKRYRLRKTE